MQKTPESAKCPSTGDYEVYRRSANSLKKQAKLIMHLMGYIEDMEEYTRTEENSLIICHVLVNEVLERSQNIANRLKK